MLSYIPLKRSYNKSDVRTKLVSYSKGNEESVYQGNFAKIEFEDNSWLVACYRGFSHGNSNPINESTSDFAYFLTSQGDWYYTEYHFCGGLNIWGRIGNYKNIDEYLLDEKVKLWKLKKITNTEP